MGTAVHGVSSGQGYGFLLTRKMTLLRAELEQTLTGIFLFVLGIPRDKDFESGDGTLPNLNRKA